MPLTIITEGKLTGEALRDRLLQIIYDAGAIRTGAIGKQLGNFVMYEITCGHEHCADPVHRRRFPRDTYYSSDYMHQLRRLAKSGEIVRVPQNKPNEGDEWRAPDYQPLDVDTTPPDDDAERVLLSLRGKPRRISWQEQRKLANWRCPPGTVGSSEIARARGRALSRLQQAHLAEFERYWIEEQWKIADGERD